MKKITIVTLAALTIGLASGCGGKDTPFTIDAGESTGSVGDSTVVPGGTETISEGAARSGDEVITPTGSDTVSDFGSGTGGGDADDGTSETPDTPAAPVTGEDTTDIGTPPSPPSGTFTIDPSILGRVRPELGGIIRITPVPASACTNPTVTEALRGTGYVRCDEGYCSNAGIVALAAIFGGTGEVDVRDCALVLAAQHDQDVKSLLEDWNFPSEGYNSYEMKVRSRVMAERAAIEPVEFRDLLKAYVVSVLRDLINAERNNGDVFNARVAKLGQIIAAFKSGDATRSGNAVRDGELSNADLLAAVSAHPDQLKKAGSYLELQFAEAYKDMGKASHDAREEVREQSTLVHGGDNLDLVYKPDGFVDQGFNHIRGLDNADLWYEGAANWSAVAGGLKGALQAASESHVAREIDATTSGFLRRDGEIGSAIFRW